MITCREGCRGLTPSDLKPTKQYAVLHKGGSYSFQSDKPVGDDVVACFDLVHSEKPLGEDFFDENRQGDKQMKTYNTYQEAKIANPDGKVYESIGGKFAAESDVSHIALCGCNQGWNECNPSDYCMTVEGFLDAGHLFVDGDLYINYRSRVCEVGEFGHSSEACNISGNIAYNRDAYILRAAALERPRNKVEFVKVDDSIWHLEPDFRLGELFAFDGSRDYVQIETEGDFSLSHSSDNLYRRIETEINWQDEIEEKYDAVKMPRGEDSDLYLGSCWDESAFVEFCVDVAKVNGFKLVN